MRSVFTLTPHFFCFFCIFSANGVGEFHTFLRNDFFIRIFCLLFLFKILASTRYAPLVSVLPLLCFSHSPLLSFSLRVRRPCCCCCSFFCRQRAKQTFDQKRIPRTTGWTQTPSKQNVPNNKTASSRKWDFTYRGFRGSFNLRQKFFSRIALFLIVIIVTIIWHKIDLVHLLLFIFFPMLFNTTGVLSHFNVLPEKQFFKKSSTVKCSNNVHTHTHTYTFTLEDIKKTHFESIVFVSFEFVLNMVLNALLQTTQRTPFCLYQCKQTPHTGSETTHYET